MKVNCLFCGHAFGVDASYCDYEGLLRCSTCGGLLDVRFQDGLVRSVRPGSLSSARTDPSPRNSSETAGPHTQAA